MRTPYAVLALLSAFVAACESDPTIACNSDNECLSGQHCSGSICRSADSPDPSMPDAADETDGNGSGMTDAGTPDSPPPTCTPTCSGSTPYCVGGSCVQCRTSLDCPLTAPTCGSNHVCKL
jgi:hypothetical protein